jgi:DNA-binding NarL/FixJ family response regulator
LPADPITVLLADDHTLFREGLAGLLGSYGGMEVVGSTPNGEEAVALAQRTRPDVVLMQVQIPFERAKDILTRMRALSPPPKVVIVTMFESPRYLRELMNLGASAFLIKSASTEHLIGAIRAAVFDPKGENVVVGMPREMLEEVRRGSGGVLSARELEILLLAARGLSNGKIAGHLGPQLTCLSLFIPVHFGVRCPPPGSKRRVLDFVVSNKDVGDLALDSAPR